MVMMERYSNLFEVVHAADATGGFAGLLHRRQEKSDQHRDDGKHDKEFYQREAVTCSGHACRPAKGCGNMLQAARLQSHVRRPNKRLLFVRCALSVKSTVLCVVMLAVADGAGCSRQPPYEGKSVSQLERMLHDPSAA